MLSSPEKFSWEKYRGNRTVAIVIQELYDRKWTWYVANVPKGIQEVEATLQSFEHILEKYEGVNDAFVAALRHTVRADAVLNERPQHINLERVLREFSKR